MKLSILLIGVLLVGCQQVSQIPAGINTTISKAQQDAQAAINLYQITKGVAQVAAVADPAVGAAVNSLLTVLDPQVTKAQIDLNDATTDANALETLAAAIITQSNTLLAQSAPVIKVVPSP